MTSLLRRTKEKLAFFLNSQIALNYNNIKNKWQHTCPSTAHGGPLGTSISPVPQLSCNPTESAGSPMVQMFVATSHVPLARVDWRGRIGFEATHTPKNGRKNVVVITEAAHMNVLSLRNGWVVPRCESENRIARGR